MNAAWHTAVESQFGAGLDALEKAIRACPPRAWADPAEPVERQFWYLAFHTVFWLDCYGSDDEHGYVPPAPFTLGEIDPAGVYPERTYTPDEVLGFLAHTRARLREAFAALDEHRAAARSGFERHDMSVLELLVYNLRHVQHHTSQLQWLLRQHGATPPRWVGRGRL